MNKEAEFVERCGHFKIAVVGKRVELQDGDGKPTRFTADQAQRIGLALMTAGQKVEGPKPVKTLKQWC